MTRTRTSSFPPLWPWRSTASVAAFAQTPAAKPAAPTAAEANLTGHEARRRRTRRRPGQAGPGSRGLGLQLRRARLPGSRDVEVPHRPAREERLHGHARPVGHSDGVGGHLRQRQAGHRPRLRHRRHSAVVAEARRGLPRSDRRRRARTRRGPQHRHAAQHRGGDRRQARHGAREAARHADALARRGRRAAWPARRGSCATACSRTSTSRSSRTSATTSTCRGAPAAATA